VPARSIVALTEWFPASARSPQGRGLTSEDGEALILDQSFLIGELRFTYSSGLTSISCRCRIDRGWKHPGCCHSGPTGKEAGEADDQRLSRGNDNIRLRECDWDPKVTWSPENRLRTSSTVVPKAFGAMI
jgi:hypothetical protein